MRANNLERKDQSGKVKTRRLHGFPFYALGLIIFVSMLLVMGCPENMKFPKLKLPGGKSSRADEVGTLSTEEKKAELLKELERKYENPDAHYELGRLYHSEGLWAQAEDHYNIALGFKPAHREAQAALVKVMLDSGDEAKASHYSDIFMNQAAGSATESLKLAIAFQRQYLDEKAMACYQQALRLAPNSAKINRQIGYYYLSKGDRERAKDYLTRSFDLNPNQAEVAGELGRLGVEVRIPRKKEKYTKNLDKIVEETDK